MPPTLPQPPARLGAVCPCELTDPYLADAPPLLPRRRRNAEPSRLSTLLRHLDAILEPLDSFVSTTPAITGGPLRIAPESDLVLGE
jgi:hypothetical protein